MTVSFLLLFQKDFLKFLTFDCIFWIVVFVFLLSIYIDPSSVSLKRIVLVFGVGFATYCVSAVSSQPERLLKYLFYSILVLLSLSLIEVGFLYLFGENLAFPDGGGQLYRSVELDGEHYGYLVSFRKVLFLGEYFSRPSGFTANANTIAVYSVIGIFIGISFLNVKSVKFFLILIPIVFLIISFSRGGFLFFLSASVFLMCFLRGDRRFSYLFVLLVFLIPVIMVLFFFSQSHDFFGLQVFGGRLVAGEEILSDPLRFSVWRLVSDSFLNNPIGGVGFGLVQEKVIQPSGIISSAHSVPFTMFAELGVVGGMMMYLLWGAPIVVLLRKKAKTPMLNAVIGALLTGLFVHQCFDSSVLRYHPFNYIFFLLAGLAFNPRLYVRGPVKLTQGTSMPGEAA